MKSISVFCGSSNGRLLIYNEAAFNLGKILAEKNIKLIYGGAKIGLMGQVADGVLKNGGEAIGIIPDFLKTKEVAHDQLTELITVKTMHERKTRMSELSEGVIALPGGFGTMEEFFEILTWGQLGLHSRPMGLLNINKFYDPLTLLFEKMTEDEFLKDINRDMVLVDDDCENLIQKMMQYTPPEVPKWINLDKT